MVMTRSPRSSSTTVSREASGFRKDRHCSMRCVCSTIAMSSALAPRKSIPPGGSVVRPCIARAVVARVVRSFVIP
eukprot:8692398-Pyramimonas_sp.AAC.1